MAVQAQWSLESTSTSFISVAQGVLRAATSDNVQPLAILACERFGNTLAMSQETCRKMETAVLPTPKPATLRFLGAVVGYSANDCATQFGKSLAGLQFLGLASALVTSYGPFKGGNALEIMLKSSAADRTLLPTARQLKDLLASLEHRCLQSRFPDTVVGWHTMMNHALAIEWDHPSCPPAEGLNNLVDVFRQLYRIGQATVVKATVKCNTSASWVVAFTKWCLGLPPSVYFDDGTAILEQPDSKVTIIVMTTDRSHSTFQVDVHHVMGSPTELLVSGAPMLFNGMVSISHYGSYRLQQYRLDSGEAFLALKQALPFALQQVITSLTFSKYRVFDHSHSFAEWPDTESKQPRIDDELLELRLVPFPHNYVVAKMLSSFLNTDSQLELQALSEGMLIADLPRVDSLLSSLQVSCDCVQCDQIQKLAARSQAHCYKTCLKQDFFHHLTSLVVDILALSLFHTPELLLVNLDDNLIVSKDVFDAAHIILTSGRPIECSVTGLVDWALMRVGHFCQGRTTRHNWVMSCIKGQAVYPSIFDTYSVHKRGYLALSWLPGLLRYDGESYAHVQNGTFWPVSLQDPVQDDGIASVSQPCNLVPDLHVVWKVGVGDGKLDAGLTLLNKDNLGSHAFYCPALTWINLASALMLETCPHNRSATLDDMNRSCAYTGPISPVSKHLKREGNEVLIIGVVAVDGADDLRLFSLTCGNQRMPLVLRGDACLQCCLDVCKRTKSPVLIL